MKMRVDYYKDVNDAYEHLFMGAYEKANIWPMTNAVEGMTILLEEIKESQDAVINMIDYFNSKYFEVGDCSPMAKGDLVQRRTLAGREVETIKGLALSAIMELLQVIAVCNKYGNTFELERDSKHKEVGNK